MRDVQRDQAAVPARRTGGFSSGVRPRRRAPALPPRRRASPRFPVRGRSRVARHGSTRLRRSAPAGAHRRARLPAFRCLAAWVSPRLFSYRPPLRVDRPMVCLRAPDAGVGNGRFRRSRERSRARSRKLRQPGISRAGSRTFTLGVVQAAVMARFSLLLLFVGCVHAADDNDWRMPARDYASTRYSPLADISVANVRQLKEVWNFTTGVQAGHEAAPLFADGLVFVVTPYPNHVFALDTAGKLRWKYDPKANPSSQGVACCDLVNRGAFYDSGRLYFNTLDGQAIALDARNGKELWRTKLGNIELGET